MDIEEIKDFRPLILVAEDDDSNFKLIKAIIGKKCDILWAKNGEEMLNLYREHTQDAHARLLMLLAQTGRMPCKPVHPKYW